MNITEILENAAAILQNGGVAEARREAKSLLAFALGRNQTFLIAHSEYELSSEEASRFRDFIARRAGREPFQYIVGRQEFCGLDFAVTRDVLIPRPETAMLVEAAIEFLQNKAAPTFCEVGVGSGCIAVSILHALETAGAVGLDVSEKALQMAARNAKTHGVKERLKLNVSDVFNNLENETFALIVTNPPYIPIADIENLQAEVRDYEPPTALTDGGDGFSVIRKIIAGAPRFLQSNGCLLMEVGFDQASEVDRMFNREIWLKVEILPDFQNIPRMVKALKK